MPFLPGRRKAVFLLVALFTAAPLGCSGGDGKPKSVTISGKVVFANGKPLTTGMIVFSSTEEGGDTQLTAIQKDGTFSFSEVGVIPGTYKVKLATAEGEAAAEGDSEGKESAAALPVPKKYLEAETSGWTATIKESDNKPFTFTIGAK